MKLEAFEENVILKRETEDTHGSIIIPDTAQEKSLLCEVISVGSDVLKISLEPGDKVIVGKYAGMEVSIEGEDYLIVNKIDIVAKVV